MRNHPLSDFSYAGTPLAPAQTRSLNSKLTGIVHPCEPPGLSSFHTTHSGSTTLLLEPPHTLLYPPLEQLCAAVEPYCPPYAHTHADKSIAPDLGSSSRLQPQITVLHQT